MTLPKHEDIILNSMIETREKWESLVLIKAHFWMVWRCRCIPCFLLFRTNGKKEDLDDNDIRHGYGNGSSKKEVRQKHWFSDPSPPPFQPDIVRIRNPLSPPPDIRHIFKKNFSSCKRKIIRMFLVKYKLFCNIEWQHKFWVTKS